MSADRAKNIAAPTPSSVRLTREGWYWLLLCAVLMVIGLNKGINLLCLLAYVMLTCLGLNVLLAGRRLRQLHGRRRIGDPAFAGDPFGVDLRATNGGRSRLIGVGLEDHAPGQIAFASSPELPAGRTMIQRREVTLPARGRYTWGPLEAVSGYPFGLARRRVTLTSDEDVLVLPRLGRLHRGRLRRFLTPIGLAHVPMRRQARRHPTAQSEFHGLRAFRSGDSPRWIHWRTSARCGELMVREFEDVPTDNLILVLDPWRPATAESPLSSQGRGELGTDSHFSPLEDAVSLAATICWEWCRQKGDRLVLAVAGSEPTIIDGSTSKEHAIQALECLAALTGDANPDQTPLLDTLAAIPLPPASILVVSSRNPGPLQAALALRLHRPAVGLGVDQLSDCDFYEKPESNSAKRTVSKRGQDP
jgi:uncharacterized protein (DUF58 family)